MDRKYTIRDIAELSGFSFKTVSRVINDEPNVRTSTREKIRQVIAATNYKPNLYARNLNHKTNKNILISIRKTHEQNTTQWFDIFMSFMHKAGRHRSYTVIQEVIYDDSELEYSILEKSGGYIDLLVLFYLEDNDRRVDIARRNDIPCISFGKNKDVPISISNNNIKGMSEAAMFLFDRGLTRICMFLGAEIGVNLEREAALRAVYARHVLPPEHLEIVYHMNNLEKIRQCVDGKITEGRLPQVFFVSGDDKAIAIYNAIYSRGLSIPEDVSIMGFDNIPISQYYYPPLTTMEQNFEQLAAEMLAVIDRLLNGETDIRSIVVDPRLIIRDSVKPL